MIAATQWFARWSESEEMKTSIQCINVWDKVEIGNSVPQPIVNQGYSVIGLSSAWLALRGNFCDLTQDQCCDGLECVFDAVSVSWECLPCIALGSPCQPEGEDASVCCGDSNFCVIENVGEHGYCKHCALTGQSCQSDEECYYNNAEINKNICSSGVCINAEKGGHICSGLYQICVAQTGYTVDCCENLNCEPIGTCS